MVETANFGNITWHHIINPSDENLEYLKEKFNFHPLDLEDCRSYTQRPKIDIYDNYFFLILHFPYFDKVNKFLKTKEVKIFWGKDYIITIGQTHWVVKDLFNLAKQEAESDKNKKEESSDAILYKILQRLMDETYLLLNRLGHEIEIINRQLFNKKSEATIEHISIVRKNIIILNTIFKPQLRLFHKFESGEIAGFAENMEEYWGNILDYYQKMWDMVEDYEELIEGLSKTFDSLQANKTNEIMKVLTIISTTLLPLTFITGLFGMNVNLPFQTHPYGFWIIMILSLVIIILLLFFFKRKKWIG
jgi:magnesium transporter